MVEVIVMKPENNKYTFLPSGFFKRQHISVSIDFTSLCMKQ